MVYKMCYITRPEKFVLFWNAVLKRHQLFDLQKVYGVDLNGDISTVYQTKLDKELRKQDSKAVKMFCLHPFYS